MPNITFPWNMDITVKGDINGTAFTVRGAGVIRTYGVYDAILNFDRMPEHFHPSAIATFSVSNCCGAGASMRNGGLNMSAMGVEEYQVHRRLRLAGGEINFKGHAYYTPEALVLDIKVDGDAQLPDDLIAHSTYFKRVYQTAPDVILAVGEGSLYRADGTDLAIQVDTRYNVKPTPLPNPMKAVEYRVATEDGTLFGCSYSLRIHSVFDGSNTGSKLDSLNCGI